MTLTQFTSFQIDDLGRQLQAVYAGIGEDALAMRPTNEAMSGKEMLEHLGDCYSAFLHDQAGSGKYEWGSYKLPDGSFDDQWHEVMKLRDQVKAAVMASDNDESAKSAHNYVVAHDAYHIGQMALLRLKTDPSWDPYSLYQG